MLPRKVVPYCLCATAWRAGAPSGEALAAVDASVGQVSCWASPHNLSVAVAIAQQAGQLAADLAALQAEADSEAEQRVVGLKAGDAAGGRSTYKFGLGQLAVLLSLQPMGLAQSSAPLFELSAGGVAAEAAAAGGLLEGRVEAELQMNVFNGSKLGWEPTLEPWRFGVEFAAPLASAVAGGPHCRRLHLEAQQGMELTVSEATAGAAALAGGALGMVAAVAESPGSLVEQLEANSAEAAFSAAYWLQNLTGSAVEVRLDSPEEARASSGSEPDPPSEPRWTAVPPGGRAKLAVLPPGGVHHWSLHTGEPSAAEGVARPRARAASQALPRRQDHRTLMRFHLKDLGQTCGPVRLDRPASTEHGLSLAPAGGGAAATVVCDVREGRYGGYTVSLHSGVKVSGLGWVAWLSLLLLLRGCMAAWPPGPVLKPPGQHTTRSCL